MPNPKDYPVLSATLVAPLVTWLAARYLPGLELSAEQASYLAGGVLGAGSLLATNLVRSRRTLPDPDATRGNTAVRVEPTTVRIRDVDFPPGESEPLRPRRPDPGRPIE